MNLLGVAGRAIRDQYRLALTLFVAAPLAVALVIVPEFAQHAAEIELGFFDSRATARALAMDSTRWAFGYVKLAGLALAFLACARAAWTRIEPGAARWNDLRGVAWGRLLVGLALFVGIGSLAGPFRTLLPPPAFLGLSIVLAVASLPFLFVALAGLFGDRATPWPALLRRCGTALLLIVLLMLSGFGALQAVHQANHLLAFGQPRALVWLLMAWDALVVGAIAATTGAAFALGYARVRSTVRSRPA